MKIRHSLWLFLLVSSSCAKQITIYTIGDSTMANKPKAEINPERGWGQMLPQYFNNQVTIKNKAVNGRSTRSFLKENRWDSIYKELKRGDFVFIQFGHNDGKITDSTRYTNPQASYRHNLIRFVEDTRLKGANPVLFTSISRRNFNENGSLIDTHGNYTLVTRMVADEYKVQLIDLQYFTEVMEETYGREKSKKLHLSFAAGEHEYYSNGISDNTHLSVIGANYVAQLAVRDLYLNNKKLKKYILNNDFLHKKNFVELFTDF